ARGGPSPATPRAAGSIPWCWASAAPGGKSPSRSPRAPVASPSDTTADPAAQPQALTHPSLTWILPLTFNSPGSIDLIRPPAQLLPGSPPPPAAQLVPSPPKYFARNSSSHLSI